MTNPRNPQPNDPPTPGGDHEPTREDVLIGRVVDGEASAADWAALESIAQSDAGVWERVGRAHRVHARLEREIEDAIAIAELIEAPSPKVVAGHAMTLRMRQYGGWAAAAAVALAWVAVRNPGGVGPGAQVAGIGPVSAAPLSVEEAYDQYINRGIAQNRVIGELQPVLVETRDLGEGNGREVIFMRQILERQPVTEVSVMSVQMDEHGTMRAVPVPVARSTGADVARQMPAPRIDPGRVY
jgi:hypothetical protein